MNASDKAQPMADADLADTGPAGEDRIDAEEAVEEAHEERIDNARHAQSVWPVRLKDVDGELKVA